MLKEQLLDLTMRAYAHAYGVKERIKKSIQSEDLHKYVRDLRSIAIHIAESQWKKLRNAEIFNQEDRNKKGRFERTAQNLAKETIIKVKQVRKSSIKPAKEIGSPNAKIILESLGKLGARLVNKTDTVDGKKSLAYLIWALGHAEEAKLVRGISVHDVSALLYHASRIELYPINISRVVYGHSLLVKQVGQEKRTKTYLLTDEGKALFKNKFF